MISIEKRLQWLEEKTKTTWFKKWDNGSLIFCSNDWVYDLTNQEALICKETNKLKIIDTNCNGHIKSMSYKEFIEKIENGEFL